MINKFPVVPAKPASIAVEVAPVEEPKKKRTVRKKQPLLFIDTNIFLDFYRSRNDAGISLLAKIDALHDLTITTCQVEMEFKKNRQKVISESVALLKPPEYSLCTPAFLSDAKTVDVIKARIIDVKDRVEGLRARILSTLEKPKTADRIYQTIHRLFSNLTALNLRHDTPEYRLVWRKAIRRFLEGRPPRKKEDTSAGDSINWEWIVRCVEQSNRDVIIVSRDADYGLTLDGKGYANTWLAEEIQERVNQQRKLILVDRLSSALKLLDIKVTREEITSERAIIKSATAVKQDEIQSLVDEVIHEILDKEPIPTLIAGTNALGWGCDTYDLEDIQYNDGIWTADLTFMLSGDQEDEKAWHGTAILGHCLVTVDKDKHVTFSKMDAFMENDSGEPEDSEEPDEPKPEKPEPEEPQGENK
jgi:PIN domain